MLPFFPPLNQIRGQAPADGLSLQQGAMFSQAQFPTPPTASFAAPNLNLSGFNASNAAASAPLLPIPPSPFLNCPSVPPMMQTNQLGGFPQPQVQFGGAAQQLNQQILALQLLGQSCSMPQNLQQFQGSVQALNIVNALQTNLGSFLPNSFSQNSNFLGGAPYGQTCLPNLMAHGNQLGVLSSPQASLLGANKSEVAGNCSMLSVRTKSFSNASSSTEGNKNSLAHDGKHGSRVNQQNFYGPVSQSPMRHNSFMSNKQPRNLNPQVVEDDGNNNKYTSSLRNFSRNLKAKTKDTNTRFWKPNFQNSNHPNTNTRTFTGVNGRVQKNWKEGKSHFAKCSKPIPTEPRRSIPVVYTENEVKQWIEARKKNYPIKANSEKKLAQSGVGTEDDSSVKLRRQQLKEILAKQAELGVEVAEIPPGYLSDSENQATGVNSSSNVKNMSDRFSNKHNKRGRHSKDKWQTKRQNSRSDSPAAPVSIVKRREPSLLQKLLSSDIKRDKSKLLQVFKFMALNSFFEHWPEKPLEFPSVTVKDVQNDSRTAIENTSTCMKNAEFDAGKSPLVKEIEGPTESCIVDDGGASEDDCKNSRNTEVDGSITTDEHAE